MPTPAPTKEIVERIVRETLERFRTEQSNGLDRILEVHPNLVRDVTISLTQAVSGDRVLHSENDPELVKTERAADNPPIPEAPPRSPANSSDRRFPGRSTHDQRSEPQPEVVLGDFRIIREVGRGGMGIVYEAEQISLRRHVALKVLPEHLMRDLALRKRFQREARAAGRLHHTHIVPVFGVGEFADKQFYVMQFIEGMGLDKVIFELRRLKRDQKAATPRTTIAEDPDQRAAEIARSMMTNAFLVDSEGDARTQGFVVETPQTRIAENAVAPPDSRISTDALSPTNKGAGDPLSPSQALVASGIVKSSGRKVSKTLTYWRGIARVGNHIADALEHAHRLGVMHRDIKPSNLLLDSQGTIWLTDFGLAKADDLDDLTGSGDVLGTLRYMPPEALNGQYDARSDVYALGLTLYELIALRPAFGEREKPQLLRQVSSETVTRLAKVTPDVPRDLETIVHKAIERDPKDRYASAAQLADDLQRFLDDEPIRARPLSTVEKIQRWRRRNPAIARMAAALAALITFAIVGLAMGNVYLSDLAQRESIARLDAVDRLADNFTFSGLVAGDRGNPTQALLWFANAAWQGRHDPERVRANTLRFRAWMRGIPQPVYASIFGVGTLVRVEFDFSGRYLLVVTEPNSRSSTAGCTIIDLVTQQPIALPEAIAGSSAVRWSPAGDQIIGTTADSVQLYSFPALQPGPRISVPSTPRTIEFNPNGTQLAIAIGRELWLWNWKDNLQHPSVIDNGEPIRQLVFGSTGTRLATISDERRASVYRLDGGANNEDARLGEPVDCIYGDHTRNAHLVFLREDTEMVVASDRTTWTWWDLAKHEIIKKEKANGEIQRLVAAPNRSTFTICHNPHAEVWDVESRSLNLRAPRTVDAYIYDAAYTPDGAALLTVAADHFARVTSLPSGVPIFPALPHQFGVRHAAWTRDGKRFATGQEDGLVRIWSTDEPGRAPITIPLGIDESLAVVSADGKTLIPAGWNHRRHQRTTRAYSVATGDPIGPVINAAGLINGAALASNGRDVLLLCSSASYADQFDRGDMKLAEQPGVVEFWDLQNGRQLGAPIATPSEPIGAAFQPGSNLAVVVCAGGEILRIDPEHGQILASERGAGDAPIGFLIRDWVRFAPSGQIYVTWGLGNTVDIWDAATGTRRQTLKPETVAHNVFFSPDSTSVFIAAENNALTCWDIKTSQPRSKIPMRNWVFTGTLSPDNSTVLTASRDKSAELWDWRNVRLLRPSLVHDHEVLDVAWSRDGHWVFTACKDGTVQSWDATTGLAIGPKLKVSEFPPVSRRPIVPRQRLYPEQLCTTADGETLVVSGLVGEIALLPLDLYNQEQREDLSELRLWAELLSGQMLHEGGGVTYLTTNEWIAKWRRYEQQFKANAVASPLDAGPQP